MSWKQNLLHALRNKFVHLSLLVIGSITVTAGGLNFIWKGDSKDENGKDEPYSEFESPEPNAALEDSIRILNIRLDQCGPDPGENPKLDDIDLKVLTLGHAKANDALKNYALPSKAAMYFKEVFESSESLSKQDLITFLKYWKESILRMDREDYWKELLFQVEENQPNLTDEYPIYRAQIFYNLGFIYSEKANMDSARIYRCQSLVEYNRYSEDQPSIFERDHAVDVAKLLRAMKGLPKDSLSDDQVINLFLEDFDSEEACL